MLDDTHSFQMLEDTNLCVADNSAIAVFQQSAGEPNSASAED